MGEKVVCPVFLICISLMAGEVGQLLLHLLALFSKAG